MEADLKNKQLATGLVILIVTSLLIGGAVWFANQTKKDDQQETATNDTEDVATSQESSTSSDVSGTSYKNGTYEATGGYISPGGSQEIKLKIVLVDNKINDTSAEGDNKTSTSSEYQNKFISNYKQLVVGKKVDEVELDQVSGSSLTSGGFHDALDRIKDQARV